MSNTEHKCPEGRDLTQLLAYVEGELDDAARRSLEAHVQNCSPCADELESLRRIDSLLREHPESCHPDDEDLYRFVAQGVDPDRKIIGHLAWCRRCGDSVEIFQEMMADRVDPDSAPAMPKSLRRKLKRCWAPESQGMVERLLSMLEELTRSPFRMPVLALGSAVSVLIIGVLVLPMLRSFVEPELPVSQAPTSQERMLPGSLTEKHQVKTRAYSKDVLRTDRSQVVRSLDSQKGAGGQTGQQAVKMPEPLASTESKAEQATTSGDLGKLEKPVAASPQNVEGTVTQRSEAPPPTANGALEWSSPPPRLPSEREAADRKAAEPSHALAQYNLGNRYRDGKDAPKDYQQAVKWYRKAAEQGFAPAQYNLGRMYENGWGVSKDYREAAKWYGKAAAQGDQDAKQALARLPESN